MNKIKILLLLLLIILVLILLITKNNENFNSINNSINNNDVDDKLFAVIINTYKRKDGSSLKNLKKLANIMNNQTYKNFTIFLNGDNYEDQKEFDLVCSLFKNKVIAENYPISFREGYFNIAKNKWSCGGLRTKTLGLIKVKDLGFHYYFNCDDDDKWTNNHIEEYYNAIKKFDKVDFLFSKSYYTNIILPREHKTVSKLYYNNLVPKPGNMVHSTLCINLKTLGNDVINLRNQVLEKIDKIKNKEIKEYYLEPMDMRILKLINDKTNKGDCKVLFIPEITCKKDTDGNIPK
jgi:hypothetical protein